MKLPLFQQFKFVGLATYQMQDSKNPKKLRLQLLLVFSFDIFTIQPNFLTENVTFRLSSFIIGSFLQFLSVLQVFSIYNYKIPKFLGQLISCFGLGAEVGIFLVENAWVVPAIELERHIPHNSVFCIIISEFCYKEEPRQVIFFIINKSSKVSSYCAILPLSLAVDLRVEDGREPPFDAQKVAQGRPKLNCEY